MFGVLYEFAGTADAAVLMGGKDFSKLLLKRWIWMIEKIKPKIFKKPRKPPTLSIPSTTVGRDF
jgi:hypothetical protein